MRSNDGILLIASFSPMTVTSFSFSQDVTWNKEKLLVSVYRSLRHAALRRSLVLLRSASLDFAKLRLTSFAQDDTLEFCFVCIFIDAHRKTSPRGHPECAFRNGGSKHDCTTSGKPAKPSGRLRL